MHKSRLLEHLIADSLLSLNALTNELHNDHFHQLLLQAIIDMIPAADAGFLFVYDEKMKKLLVKTAIGYDPVSYRKTQLAPGESITGQAYQTKRLQLINGQQSIKRAMETMTDRNKIYYEESLLTEEYPYATLAFPILNQERVLAVFTINGFQKDAYFDPILEEVLNVVTPYILLIYEHFLLIEKEQMTSAELAITYKALRKEHTQLQRTTDLYNELASLISQNKSIKELMRAIYQSTRKPIAFYDELLYPIASYGTDASERLPDNFLSLREIQYAISVKKWRLISGNGESSLLVVPVTGFETVIGFLCAWIEEDTFNDGDRLLLEYSASMLGLELMKKRTIEETNRMIIGDVFEQLILGNTDDDVVNQAKNLNLRETDFYAILVCEAQQAGDGLNQYFVKDSWIKWIEKTMKITDVAGLVTQRGVDILAILTVPGEIHKQTARSRVKDFTKALEKIPYRVRIGIGRVYQGFKYIQKSYGDAKQCLEMLRKKKVGKVLRFSDSGIDRLLFDHDQEALDLFVHDHIGPLLAGESRKEKELLYTLLVYVNCNRDLTQTTDQLAIHHNTLYYRIKKIETILQVDFSDFEEWLDISVACKIYQFLYE